MITAPSSPSAAATTREFSAPASQERVRATVAALEDNGFSVVRAANAEEAKRRVLDLIPDGAEVHSGASKTLDDTGITGELERAGRFDLLKPRIWSMDRHTQADQIRRLGAAPEIMLGSVHAITETGSLLVASMGGSQLGPYASGAGKVILVAGTQKIVSDLETGLRRINDYALPLEDARAQAAYGINSSVNKLLIINREVKPGRVTIVLVDEALGF